MRLISGRNWEVSRYEIVFLDIALKGFGYTSALVYLCGPKGVNHIFLRNHNFWKPF